MWDPHPHDTAFLLWDHSTRMNTSNMFKRTAATRDQYDTDDTGYDMHCKWRSTHNVNCAPWQRCLGLDLSRLFQAPWFVWSTVLVNLFNSYCHSPKWPRWKHDLLRSYVWIAHHWYVMSSVFPASRHWKHRGGRFWSSNKKQPNKTGWFKTNINSVTLWSLDMIFSDIFRDFLSHRNLTLEKIWVALRTVIQFSDRRAERAWASGLQGRGHQEQRLTDFGSHGRLPMIYRYIQSYSVQGQIWWNNCKQSSNKAGNIIQFPTNWVHISEMFCNFCPTLRSAGVLEDSP